MRAITPAPVASIGIGKARFHKLDAEIEAGVKSISDTFVTIGSALAEIRDDDLYKEDGYKSFEAYCNARFELSRAHAYRLIQAADVVKRLSPMGDTLGVLPNERQARELARLPAMKQQEAWKTAVATAPRGKVTQRYVAKIVNTYPRRRTARQGPPPTPPRSTSLPQYPRWDREQQEHVMVEAKQLSADDFGMMLHTLQKISNTCWHEATMRRAADEDAPTISRLLDENGHNDIGRLIDFTRRLAALHGVETAALEAAVNSIVSEH